MLRHAEDLIKCVSKSIPEPTKSQNMQWFSLWGVFALGLLKYFLINILLLSFSGDGDCEDVLELLSIDKPGVGEDNLGAGTLLFNSPLKIN